MFKICRVPVFLKLKEEVKSVLPGRGFKRKRCPPVKAGCLGLLISNGRSYVHSAAVS